MWVCGCVYECVGAGVCVYVGAYMSVWVRVCVCGCVYEFVGAGVCVYVGVYMSVWGCVFCEHACACPRACACVYESVRAHV